MQEQILQSPPWHLQGKGYCLIYKFSPSFIKHCVKPQIMHNYQGGFGIIALIDYQASPIGSYQELLFIPGRFKFGAESYYSVTKIYVSTPASVVNGQHNWGIPKELAQFESINLSPVKERIKVSVDGETIAEFVLNNYSLTWPVSSQWLPKSWKTLSQPWQQALYNTTAEIKARMNLAKLESVQTNAQFFPALGQIKPWGVFRLSDFTLCFPRPQVIAW